MQSRCSGACGNWNLKQREKMEKTIQSTIKRVATYALGFVGIIAMLALFVCIVILGPLALIPSTRTWAGLLERESMLNAKQRKILIIGVFVIILMGVFPPWTYTFKYGSIPQTKVAKELPNRINRLRQGHRLAL